MFSISIKYYMQNSNFLDESLSFPQTIDLSETFLILSSLHLLDVREWHCAYLRRRLHDLPWQANVSILHGDGRKSQLPSDSLVEVTPAGSGDIVLSVAVHILSSWGIALSAPISPDAQLKYRLPS